MPIALNGSTSKLTFSGSMPSGLPLSIFGWVKLDATGMGKVNVPFGFGQGGVVRLHRAFINGSASDEAVFQVNDGGGSDTITASSVAVQDTWMPLLITHAGTTGRIYFRGGSVVSGNLTPITWGSANRFAIGYGPHADEHFLSGEMTRVCVWTSELSQSNFDTLAIASTIPNTVDAANVWDYWALANSSDLTGVNGRVLTAVSVSNGGAEPDGSGGGSMLVLDAGSYSISGQAVGTLATRRLALDVGTYSISGQDVTLTYAQPGVYTLALDAGTYTINGVEAYRIISKTLDAGAYNISGQNVTFTVTEPESYVLTCDGGSYLVLGRNAFLLGPGDTIPVAKGNQTVSVRIGLSL